MNEACRRDARRRTHRFPYLEVLYQLAWVTGKAEYGDVVNAILVGSYLTVANVLGEFDLLQNRTIVVKAGVPATNLRARASEACDIRRKRWRWQKSREQHRK